MSQAAASVLRGGVLPVLPLPLRMMLTAFLAIIGFGYLAAIANIYHRHAQADGKSGISMDDIRAVYRGLRVAGGDASPSRMLTMIRGEMRQYLSSDADFSVLESWLKNGGKPENLDAGKGRRTPRKVIIRNCLRCHAATSGTDISRQSALGKDEFDVDPSMIARFVSSPTSQPGGIAHAPPQYTIPRLVLVSHQHMLSIPLFTLVVALLFAMTRLPSGVRHVLTPVPMIALIFDFGGWWLARVSDIGVYSLAAAGAAFGLVFGLQIIVVVIDLWRPSTTPPPWA